MIAGIVTKVLPNALESFQKIVRYVYILSIHEGNKAFECETCDKSYLWVKVNPPFYPI